MITCKDCKKLKESNAELMYIIEALREDISLRDRVFLAIKDFIDDNKYKTNLKINYVFDKLIKLIDKYDFNS